MSSRSARRAIVTLVLLMLLPATAEAYTVTVHVHGAGKVDEITPRNLMDCTKDTARSETTVSNCIAGTETGHYSWGDVVELAAVVPSGHHDRGWRFSHWLDSSAGGGKINCDETGGPNQPPDTNCKFAIFENLEVDLYFIDVEGPQSTAFSSGPSTPTRFTSAQFNFGSEDLDAGYECRLEKPGGTIIDWYTCGSTSDKSESRSDLATNGQYTFRVRGKDPTGNVDPSPATWTFTVDTVAPTVTLGGLPAHGAHTSSRSASFTENVNESATVACALDGTPISCSAPIANLEDGSHTFSAQATDPAGNVGPTATRTWTVDTVAPVVAIDGDRQPGETTKQTGAALTATADSGTLVCTLDGQPAACALTKTGLADGSHTFSAQSTDTAGNVGGATRTWTVDTTGPVVTFTSAPAAVSGSATATFAWTSSEAGTSECSLDGAAFSDCESGLSLPGLADGTHTFRVRAADALDNVGSATEHAWRVDTAVPDTTLLSGPAEGSTSAQPSATFEFASPESATSFECRLDGGAFAACSSPAALSGLTNDDHVFEVRAVDQAGNVDATPARRAWRVNSLDGDADGVNRPADCRDDDAAIRPGAADTPGDGVDQDCSGADATVAVDADRDDDGVNAPLDCNDGNPAIRPGAVDVPRDRVDQDCSGGDAAFPVVGATLTYKWSVRGSTTRIVRLRLTKLVAGTTVKVTCKGKRCPVQRRSAKPRRGVVDVRRLLRRKPLRAGSTLTLTISRPGHTAKVVTFRVRRAKAPRGGSFACLEPGARRPGRCR